MIINVDQEGFNALNQVCDAVLKTHGINAVNIAVNVLANIKTIDTDIKEEIENEVEVREEEK